MSKNGQKYAALKIGITGGIGSGKTTVCKIFENLGIPVYYADERAKVIMAENESGIKKINKLFGPEAYFKDGRLNRTFIAAIVFQDKKKLQSLNSIVHPALFEDGEIWHENQTGVP